MPGDVRMEKLNNRSRAGKKGKVLLCPHCFTTSRAYHMCWSALGCLGCRAMVEKNDYFVAPDQNVNFVPLTLQIVEMLKLGMVE